MNYLMSLDIKLTEVYGMSESSGVHSGNLPWKIKFGSVGVVSDVTVKSKLVRVSQLSSDGLLSSLNSSNLRVAMPR